MSAYTFATWRLNSAQSLTIADGRSLKSRCMEIGLYSHFKIVISSQNYLEASEN